MCVQTTTKTWKDVAKLCRNNLTHIRIRVFVKLAGDLRGSTFFCNVYSSDAFRLWFCHLLLFVPMVTVNNFNIMNKQISVFPSKTSASKWFMMALNWRQAVFFLPLVLKIFTEYKYLILITLMLNRAQGWA